MGPRIKSRASPGPANSTRMLCCGGSGCKVSPNIPVGLECWVGSRWGGVARQGGAGLGQAGLG